MLVTTLVVVLGAPGTVFARGRWQDVLAPRGGGHAAVSGLGAEWAKWPSIFLDMA